MATAAPLTHLGGCLALVASLGLVGCAGVTPPPRFSEVSPADPKAPESAVAAPAPILTGDGELAEGRKESEAPDHHEHEP